MVTALAFHLQSLYNSLLDLFREDEEAKMLDVADEDETEDAREEKIADIEFMLGELLQLALHLDYSDEVGRRKMFGIVR